MSYLDPLLDRLAALEPTTLPVLSLYLNTSSDQHGQGEDIAQARNKQKHAENLARQRTEIGARARKPAPQDGKASPDAGPTRSAKTAARKTRAAPLPTPPGHKRGHNVVPGSTGLHARFPKAAPGVAPRPRGTAPQLSAKQATKRTSGNLQGADKRGKRSTAQKRAASRHEFAPMPATNAVAGAFGNEPSPRRLPMRK